MGDTENLIRAMRDAASVGDWLKVDDLASGLPRKPDFDLVVELLGLLRDDLVGLGVQFGLVHAAEDADMASYVGGVIHSLPSLLTQSRDWVSTVVMRVLNSEAYLNCLIDMLRDATPDQRVALLAAMDIVESEDVVGNKTSVKFADQLRLLRGVL